MTQQPIEILFICTGNTCRSPLAEAIAKQMIAERALSSFSASSAGVSAWDGAPASDGSLLVGMENGLDLNKHRSRMLSPEIVANSDYIFAMATQHLQQVEAIGGQGRTWLLKEFAEGAKEAVSDPFGGDLPVYRATFEELSKAISSILDRLTSELSTPE